MGSHRQRRETTPPNTLPLSCFCIEQHWSDPLIKISKVVVPPYLFLSRLFPVCLNTASVFSNRVCLHVLMDWGQRAQFCFLTVLSMPQRKSWEMVQGSVFRKWKMPQYCCALSRGMTNNERGNTNADGGNETTDGTWCNNPTGENLNNIMNIPVGVRNTRSKKPEKPEQFLWWFPYH